MASNLIRFKIQVGVYKKIHNQLQILPNIVFGWVDFRGDGKYRKENLSFHCLAMRGKWEEWKTREKIFSLGPQNFFLPNWEEKQ